MQELDALIRSLPPAQRAALDQIAIAHDTGLPPRTTAALVRKGLVIASQETRHFRDGLPPMEVTRYHVPLPVHYAWCMLCAAEWDGQEEEETPDAAY